MVKKFDFQVAVSAAFRVHRLYTKSAHGKFPIFCRGGAGNPKLPDYPGFQKFPRRGGGPEMASSSSRLPVGEIQGETNIIRQAADKNVHMPNKGTSGCAM